MDEHLPISQERDEEDDDSLLLAAIESGDRNKSREILLSQYSEDPENDELKIALAMQLLPDRLEDAEKLVGSVQVPERFSLETEAVQTIKHLNDIQKGEVELPESEKATLYRNAAESIFALNFDDAANKFINVLMIDRSLDEDGARKACVALFRMLGDKHPVSLAYRRRFSMALY